MILYVYTCIDYKARVSVLVVMIKIVHEENERKREIYAVYY